MPPPVVDNEPNFESLEEQTMFREMMLERRLDMEGLDEEERQIQLEELARQHEYERALARRVKADAGRDDRPKEEPKKVEQDKPDDLFEDISLLGTHRGTFKTEEGLNSRHNAAVTYDATNGRYYVMLLGNQTRQVAVISDLHRFGEHFIEKNSFEPVPKLRKKRSSVLNKLEQALSRLSGEAADSEELEIRNPETLLDF